MTSFARLSDAERNELWAVLALRHAWGIGPLRAKKLLDYYGSALAAVQAGLEGPSAWAANGLVAEPVARRFAGQRWRDKAGDEWAACKRSDAGLLLYTDKAYPEVLRQTVDAPLLLYYLGDISLLNGPAVGVVGARRCTCEGIAVSAFFSRALSRAGVSIVSGMAKGIDRAAHIAGLEGPGRSVAVLGTGVDVPYPSCNADVYAKLREHGLILSEFAPGTAPKPAHFPVRNRIISGLSQGVLVVEAASRSGSLITARLALEQNRDVFAVPGHTMAAVSQGCRDLIRTGAKPVFNADDILDELAPLLTLEARKALEKRRQGEQPEQGQKAETAAAGTKSGQTVRNKTGQKSRNTLAENAAKDPACLTALLDGSEVVLPGGDLPWIAPDDCAPAAPAPAQAHAGQTESGQPPSGQLLTGGGISSLNADERAIINALVPGPRDIDFLAEKLGMEVARLSGLLTLLEMRAFVAKGQGMSYRLAGACAGD